MRSMITGAHVLIYSSNPDADRVFFRDVLGSKYVDVGHGWLIFALPPAEVAIHPGDETEGPGRSERKLLGASLYLMCDDLDATMRWLAEKKVQCAEVSHERWGRKTTIRLPSGGDLGLYQPMHPTALNL
jgi:catechol 2,3-dioxygenase-like lactoylglutathione lyase family enzyme